MWVEKELKDGWIFEGNTPLGSLVRNIIWACFVPHSANLVKNSGTCFCIRYREWVFMRIRTYKVTQTYKVTDHAQWWGKIVCILFNTRIETAWKTKQTTAAQNKNWGLLIGFPQDNSSCFGIPVGFLVPWNFFSMTAGPRNCTGGTKQEPDFLCRKKVLGKNTEISSVRTLLAIISDMVKPENSQIICKIVM